MSRIFYPSSEKLKFLLASIHNREVALPDFQRDFVWEPRETEELLESILQNFPAGTLLRIKNSAGFYFAPREFAGAPELDGHTPSYLILDGQQRLTSLYQALHGAGSHRYFMDLQTLLGGKDLEDSVFYARKGDAKQQFGTVAKQATTLTFPLERVFGDGGGFEDWLDQVLDLRDGKDKKDLKQAVRALRKEWIQNLEDYEFPVVTLSDDTSAEAVCTIFETLNRTGVKLSVFDLLTARFWPENVKLRDLWDQARAEHPIITDFEVEPYYLLQAVALATAKGAPSCKRKDVLSMKPDQIRKGWSDIARGLANVLQLLRDDCGVMLPGWLPYNTILSPAAAAMASVGSLTGPRQATVRDKFKRWFWCSVFGQAYEKAPNSQAIKDYSELKVWFSGGKAPETVERFDFKSDLLRETTPRQRAVYRGVIALILRNGARDFHSGKRITASMMLEQKIDDHHVFPRGFLTDAKIDVQGVTSDCVLNRTLIDKETNIRIGKRAPSDYLSEVDGELGRSKFKTLLESHLLPEKKAGPLLTDEFGAYLNARQELITAQVIEVTS